MRFSFPLLTCTLLVASTNAVKVNLPDCVLSCLTSTSFGPCAKTDATCLCSSTQTATFGKDLTTCINADTTKCSIKDKALASGFCAQVAATNSEVKSAASSVASSIEASVTGNGTATASATGTSSSVSSKSTSSSSSNSGYGAPSGAMRRDVGASVALVGVLGVIAHAILGL